MSEQRLYRIISQVFDVPVERITAESGPDDISSWDSVGLLNLALALEAEYGIQLDPDDMADMLSVNLVKTILKERGVSVE
jgi:acyl carrier protein